MRQRTTELQDDSRPDLLPKAKATQKLVALLEIMKQEKALIYPPSLSEFYTWLRPRLEVQPSALQSWINQASAKVYLIKHPAKEEPILILKSDIVEFVAAIWVPAKIRHLLEKIKTALPNQYPVLLDHLKKELIEIFENENSGIKLPTKEWNTIFTNGIEGIELLTEGKTKRICFSQDKPPDLDTLLSEEFLCQCAQKILQEKKIAEREKYPCSQNELIKLMVKEIQKKYPAVQISEKALAPYFPRCYKVIQVEPPAGKTKKVCLPGHEILIKPPTGQVLTKLLMELLDLREQLTYKNLPQTAIPKINTEQLFWSIHERLDQLGLQDRAVPIPKLWHALKDQMSRNTFESLLQSLADRQAIQLERRTTMDGLSQNEIDECYHAGDKIFYNARRLQ